MLSRYVTYNVDLPEHALYAVKILWWVCQCPLAQPELVGLFTSTEVCQTLGPDPVLGPDPTYGRKDEEVALKISWKKSF